MATFDWVERSIRSNQDFGGSAVYQANPNDFNRSNDSYSCESMYMQCYDLSDSESDPDDPREYPDSEPVVKPKKDSGRKNHKKLMGRLAGLRKTSDDERASLSYSLQARNRGNPASWENVIQNERNAALVSMDKDGEESDETEYRASCFMDSLDDQQRDRAMSTGTVIQTSPSRGRRQRDPSRDSPPSPPPQNHNYTKPIYPNNISGVGHQREYLPRNNTTGMFYDETSSRRDQDRAMTTAQVHRKNNIYESKQEPRTGTNMPNFSGAIRRYNSRHPDSVLASERESVVTAATNFSAESELSSQKVSDTVVNHDPSGEMALDAFKMSKTEIVDKMYRDRNDDSEPGEQRWLWVSCKIVTWTLLCLAAAAPLICAKLSLAAITNALLIPPNATEINPFAALSIIVKATAKVPVEPPSLISTRPTSFKTGVNKNVTLQPNQSRYDVSRNLTVSVVSAPLVASLPQLSSQTSCQPSYQELLSRQNRSLPGFLDHHVYKSHVGGSVDTAALVMLFMIVMIPPVIGVFVGVYSFIRWEGVRRARLTWRAVLLTFLLTSAEATGSCLYLLKTMPHLAAPWVLITPMLVMAGSSIYRVFGANWRARLRQTLPYCACIVVCNVGALLLVCAFSGGIPLRSDVPLSLFWSLPVSTLILTLVWMPPCLLIQREGTHEETEVAKFAGVSTPETKIENKIRSLRSRHKLLSAVCRVMTYPLMFGGVIALTEGLDLFTVIVQDHLVAVMLSGLSGHRLFWYFLLNVFAVAFSPIVIWIVFMAAIEVQVTLSCRGVTRPVSGALVIFVVTVITSVVVGASQVPCQTSVPAACCPQPGPGEIVAVVIAAILLVIGNLPVIYNVMIANHVLFITSEKVFTLGVFNPVLADPWVWLNIPSSDLHKRAKVADFRAVRNRSKIYICTTMYREDESEMLELLKSIKRINEGRSPSTPQYEAHIYFDGALTVKDEAPRFNSFALQLVALVENTFDVKLEMFVQKATPYGIIWEVPLQSLTMRRPMMLYIHLKDNAKVKKKKRWSQIMYMAWALEHDCAVPIEDRYVLITDGDTKFYDKGPVALLDSLVISPEAAAVVGRVHPIVTGSPLVWYQIFEYAATFWIYKASNDQLGTDLCCSGCFTMYRGSMLREVIKEYAAEACTASDFLMIDMGEDLWLSTLLIRSGYKLKYCSVADVYTRAPHRLDEYYKQRRRWYLSALAYFFFFLREFRRFKFGNRHVTMVYLLYQALMLFFPLISTSTLGVVLAVAQSYALHIPLLWSVILVSFIFILQHLICLCFSSDIQVKASAILSILPSISIVIIFVSVIATVVQDFTDAFTVVNGTTVAASRVTALEAPIPIPSIMLVTLASLTVISGLIHPKEFHYIFYVVFYVIGNPVGYIFLRSYMLCNVTDQSWGTRETKIKPKGGEGSGHQETTPQKMLNLLRSLLCCWKKDKASLPSSAASSNGQSAVPDVVVATPDGRMGSSYVLQSMLGTKSPTGEETPSDPIGSLANSVFSGMISSKLSIAKENDTVSVAETVDSLAEEMEGMGLTEEVKARMLVLREELEPRSKSYSSAVDKVDRFWERLIDLKLSNVETRRQKRSNEQVQSELQAFQKRMLIVYFVVNVVWIATIGIFWTLVGDSIKMSGWTRHFDIVVIVAVPYLFFTIIQFVAMFIHRMGVLFYLLARTKCRLGGFIRCGYPTKFDPSLYDGVSIGPDDSASGFAVTRLNSVDTQMSFSGQQSTTSPDSSSGLQMRRITPSDGGSATATVSGSGTSPSSRSGGSSYLQSGIVTDPSKFLSSRWLLGSADKGMLTRDAAAKGMIESTSQESLQREVSPRSGRSPRSPQLPVSYSDGYLSHMNAVPARSPNPRGTSVYSPDGRGRFSGAPSPTSRLYHSPIPVRSDLYLASRDIYLPPAPASDSSQTNAMTSSSSREGTAVYMTNAAKRRMEIRRDSGVVNLSRYRRDL